MASVGTDPVGFPGTAGGGAGPIGIRRHSMGHLYSGVGYGGFCGKSIGKFPAVGCLGSGYRHLVPVASAG